MAKNKLQGLTIEVGGDTTELSKALQKPNKEAGNLQSKLKSVEQALKLDPTNTELLEQKFRLLGKAIEKDEEKLKLLNAAQKKFIDSGGDIDSDEYIELQRQIAQTTSRINKMKNSQIDVANTFNDIGNGATDLRKVSNQADKLADSLDEVEKESSSVGDALKGAFIGAGIVEGIKGISSSLSSVVEESKEYIKIMASLQTSSKLMNYSADETKETYMQLYEVLGDDQTAATTTANLQALGLSQKKLTQLTNGTIGAWAKYGDSIPIDGLAESINETVKVGAVTGTFADVLNWAGTSEDSFNKKLEGTKSAAQRANLILQELTRQGLIESADAWRENAGALTEANKAQAEWQDATAGLSQKVMPMLSKVKSGFAGLLTSVNSLMSGEMSFDQFSKNITSGLEGVLQSITETLPQFVDKGLEMLLSLSEGFVIGFPEFMSNWLDILQNFGDFLTEQAPIWIDKGFEMLSNFVQGIIDSIPVMIQKLPQVITTFANIINDNFPKILMKGAELLWQLITGILGAIPDLIANIPQIIEAFVATILAFEWLSLGKNIMNFFGDGIKSMGGFIKDKGKEIFNAVMEWIKKLPSSLWNMAKNAVSDFGKSMKNSIKFVKDGATSIFNTVVNTIKSLPSKMLGIGKDIVKGIWDGISNMGGWLLDKIGGFASDVIGGIADFFGIASPSKVMRDLVGKNLVAGIGVGIKNNEGLALNPLHQLQKEMTTTFDPSLNATVNKAMTFDSSITVESPINIDLDGKPIYQNVVRRVSKNQGSRLAFKGA